jgi:hypothetical protein
VLSTPPAIDNHVTIEFQDGVRPVRIDSLRRLLPVTVLARMVETITSQVTAWAVRKANDQGVIQPDTVGHFAQHKVHYYDVARIPALIEQLSQKDPWSVGTLVIHARYGAGRVVACRPQPNTWPPKQGREVTVEFLRCSAPVSVSVKELRRLLPSYIVAKRIGVNRRTFARLAARRGIYPDYVAADWRVRNYYDENRVEQIRTRWSTTQPGDAFAPGCTVLDPEGEVARIDFRDAAGEVRLRSVAAAALTQASDVTRLRELVSVRELARREQMSRYKLNRLLTAAGVPPAHHDGKTIYFDAGRAHEGLRVRLQREGSAITLDVLARRTGVSAEVLARKIRQGCIRTLGQAIHSVDLQEAERIEQVLRAHRSRSQNLQSLGISSWRTRGRAGLEVLAWDIVELMDVARSVSPHRRLILFDQVAWMCEGAGKKRLHAALEAYLLSKKAIGDQQLRRAANVLLALTDHLPNAFSRYQTRLILTASGAAQICRAMDARIQRLATEAGCEDAPSSGRFRVQVEESLAELLAAEHTHTFSGVPDRFATETATVYPDDDCTAGALLISLAAQRPTVGVIVKVEQQSWNAVAGCWDKTVLVRFANGEQRVNPYGRKREQASLVLLRSWETMMLFHILHHFPGRQCSDHGNSGWIERTAS